MPNLPKSAVSAARILVLTQRPAGIRGLRTACRRAGIAAPDLQIVAPEDLRQALMDGVNHAVVIEDDPPRTDALALLAQIRVQVPQLRVLVLVRPDDPRRLAALLAAGASDAVTRDQVQDGALVHSLRRLLARPAMLPQAGGSDGTVDSVLQAAHDRLVREVADREQELRITEERLAAGLAAAQIGLWEWDLALNQAFYSPTWYTMLGFEDRELPMTPATWERLMHPQDRERTNHTVQQVWSGDVDEYEAEFRMLGKSGDWHWILSRGRVVTRDGNHAPLRMIGTHTDITQRKRDEQHLRHLTEELQAANEELQVANEELQATNEELLSANDQLAEEVVMRQRTAEILREQAALLELAHDAIIVTDLDDRITYWNRGAERTYGWDRSDAVGQIAYGLLSTKFPTSFAEIKRELLDRGRWEGELEHTTRDQRCLVMTSRWAVQYDDRGRPVAFLQINRDITERKKNEQELLEQASLLHLAHDAIFVRDLDDRIVFWNRGAERVYGYTRAEAIGRVTHDLLRTKFTLPLDQIKSRALNEGQVECELTQTAKDGRLIITDSRWTVQRDGQGNPTGFLLINRDITEKNLAEQALRESRVDLNRAQAVAHVGSWRLDTQQGVLLWSDETYRIFAVPPGTAMTYELFLNAAHPDDRQFVDERWQAALRGEPYDIEHRIVAGSAVKWVRERAELEFHADGSLRGGFGTVQDVTERRELEEQLRRRAEEVETLMEIAPVALWVADDPACSIIRGNRMANAFYEAEAGENVSANESAARRFFHDGRELGADELPMQVAAATNSEVRSSDLDVLLPSGKWLHMLGSASPLRDAEGRVRGCIGGFVDITEHTRANRALRDSEERFRSVFEEATLGMALTAPDGSILTANPALSRMLGYSEEEFRTLGVAGITHPGDGQASLAAIADIVEGRSDHVRFAKRYVRKDGGVIHAGISAFPIRDAEGRLLYLTALIEDVTARYEAETALRESQERYRRLVQAAPVPMVVFRRGRVAFVNPAALRLIGEDDHRSLIGWRAVRFIYPDDRKRLDAAFRAAQRTGRESELIECRLLRTNGDIRTVELVVTAIEYDGQPALQAVIRDVTEQKAAESALIESEDRFRKLAEASFEGILFHENGTILEVNSHLLHMFGWEAEEIIGQQLSALVAPEHAALARQKARSRDNDTYELRGRRKDGSLFPVEVLDRGMTWQGRRVRVAALRDITQRREMESALRDSEERYRRLVQASPDAIFVVSDGCVVFANKAALQLFDANQEEEVLGLPYMSLLHPDCRAGAAEALDGVHTLTSEFPALEYRLLRRDGTTVDIEGHPIPFTYQGRDAVLHVAHDITVRKHIEEVIRRHNEELERRVEERTVELKAALERIEAERQRFHDVLDELPAYVCLLTPDYHFAFANRVYRQWFGNPTGNRCHADLFGRSEPCTACETYRSLSEDRPVQWEWEGPNGRTYSVFDYPFTDTDGSKLILEMGMDVTEQKTAAAEIRKLNAELEHRVIERTEALQAASEQLRVTLDNLSQGVVTSDLKGRLFRWNPAALRIHGFETPTEADRLLAEFVQTFELTELDGTVLPLEQWPLARLLRGELFEEWELRVRRLDKPWDRVFSYGGMLVRDGEGQPVLAVVTVADITERKRAEEELRQSRETLRRHTEELERLVAERTEQIQKLERQRLESEKQAAVGRMAARIAHEINNPLAGVKNSFTLVKRAIPTDHKHYEFVGRIDKEIDRIARIVRQMFELYRPEHKEPGLLKPCDVVRDVAAMLEGNSRGQGVTLRLDTSGACEPVRLHEDSLRQVLFSIIQNAIEASPAGREIHIAATAADKTLLVTVADQGCGIPADVQSRIFEPFFTTKSGLATGGLGLGLSITKGLIEAMGGRLTFETAIGQGTTFCIALPVNIEQKEVTHV